jgi:hypothetical protein
LIYSLTPFEFCDPERVWSYEPHDYYFLPVCVRGPVKIQRLLQFCQDEQGRSHIERIEALPQGGVRVFSKKRIAYNPSTETCSFV